MKTYRVTASAIIEALAEQVYAVLADYREGHPHILPPKYFASLDVERGGYGEGTVIRFQMRAFGRTQDFRAVITEPEPGRVLVETNLEPDGAVTIFRIEPAGAEQHTRVTITTEGKVRSGLQGLLEGYLTKVLLRRIYAQELTLLATLVTERSGKEMRLACKS